MDITFANAEYPETSLEIDLFVLQEEFYSYGLLPYLDKDQMARCAELKAHIDEIEHGGTWEPMPDGKYEVSDTEGKKIGQLFIMSGRTLLRTARGEEQSLTHGLEYRLYRRTSPPAESPSREQILAPSKAPPPTESMPKGWWARLLRGK